MSVGAQCVDICYQQFNSFGTKDLKWFAIQTRAKHEKIVAHRLRQQEISTFLPLIIQLRHWSDRKKLVEFPLFTSYLFARFEPTGEARVRVLRLDGVFQIVGARGEGTPIPGEQIEAVRTLVEHKVPVHPYPFMRIGQRVRIRNGAMCGVEGVLVSCNGQQRLVISIEAIQRSLALQIDGYDVEPV